MVCSNWTMLSSIHVYRILSQTEWGGSEALLYDWQDQVTKFCSFCYAFLNREHCSKWGTASDAWLRYTHARNAERLLAVPAILAMVSAVSEETMYLYYSAFYWYCKTLRSRATWGGKVLSVYNLSWREEVKSRTQGKNWSTWYQCRGTWL